MKKTLATLLLLLLFGKLNAQQKYWIFLGDKNLNSSVELSEKTKENRQLLGLSAKQFTDFPVNEAYLKTLQELDIQPLVKSKWLNAISATLSEAQIKKVKNLTFVKDIQAMEGVFFITKTQNNDSIWRTDYAMKQLGLEDFLAVGLTGKGVLVGVIDAGYYQADSSKFLAHVFSQHQILNIHDYVNPKKTNYYEESEGYGDFHGTEVLEAITGQDAENKIQVGMATEAQFYLARSENTRKEFRGEEDNWVAAMEWMDSLGVRLINTSLGYTKGFNNPKENYKPEQMDGKTSVISKAAQIAADEKGMLVVVAAGNEGNNHEWKIISTPADAEGVLAIGATNQDGLRIGYSSIGPEFLPYIKPNVSCFSLNGTSLAAPVITGFAACLMQANPTLSNKELIQVIEKSSNLANFPNNYIGFGIPNAKKALEIMQGEVVPKNEVIRLRADKLEVELPIKDSSSVVVLFHKKDATHVVAQNTVKVKDNSINLKRNAAYTRTSVVTKTMVYEVIWE